MGLIAKLLSFTRVTRNAIPASDVKTDTGGGDNKTADHFAPSGDDAHPLPGDFAILVPEAGTGRMAAIGYLDPKMAQKAQAGEKRLYARDSSGALVVEVWLKADGTAITSNANGSFTLSPDGSILGQNGNGSFELEAGGNFVVNGATIDTLGNISSPTSVSAPSMLANSKELAGHTHAILSGSSAPGPTGENN